MTDFSILSTDDTAAVIASRRRKNRWMLAALLVAVGGMASLSVWHISAELEASIAAKSTTAR